MRLVDLNVSIKKDNNEEILNFLEKYKADIYTFQEMMRGVSDGVIDQYNNHKIINDFLKNSHKYSFFGALWIAKYHEKNGVITKNFGGEAEQGNEIISRFPFVFCENIFFHKSYQVFCDVTNFRLEDHGRAVQRTIMEIENKKVQILNLHGIWNKDKVGDERTIRECEFICNLAQEINLPTIIVGDFNLHPESKSIQIMNKHFRNLIEEYKIKTTRPVVNDGLDKGNSVDDYVFVSPEIEVLDFKVLFEDVSDHYPIMFDFDIKEIGMSK